jgi:hypothetical protein
MWRGRRFNGGRDPVYVGVETGGNEESGRNAFIGERKTPD